jgi:hypothetical protein
VRISHLGSYPKVLKTEPYDRESYERLRDIADTLNEQPFDHELGTYVTFDVTVGEV